MSAPRSLLRAPALRPGDRVAVLSVSGAAPQDRLATGLDALRFAGLEPVVLPSARVTDPVPRYLAGRDDLRTADLVAALTDDSYRGIVFARGGYGAQRVLEHLDWGALAGVAPKVLAGYSDLTAVLEAVATRLGWASLLGPMVAAADDAGHYSFGSLLRALMHPERATTLHFPSATTVVGGIADGVTVGGNLAMLVSSLGTDTSRPAHTGLLVLEDVGEDDYRIDRMLTQLRRSGWLDGVRGIVCGTWVECGDPADVEAVLRDRLGDLGVPLVLGADVGHGGRVQTFPLGVAARLDADAHTVHLLDPPLVPVVPAVG